MSRTACSGSAVESTIMALRPPVSAISGAAGPAPAASARSMRIAVCVDPVKQTPAVRLSDANGPPTVGPSPGRRARTSPGMPASCISATARAAIRGVCSAGLAITGLPVTSAATTWPVKIASGKFHGEMQTKGPRAVRASSLKSRRAPAA